MTALTSILITITTLIAAYPEPDPDRIDPDGIPGSLVIGGGGQLPDSVFKTFRDLAELDFPIHKENESTKLVVIPTASASAEDDLAKPAETIELWKKRGFSSIQVLHTRDRAKANDPEFTKPLREASAVWFGGGDQNRIAEVYLGTLVETELMNLLKRGGVIGGTSAGAAIQSQIMIGGGNPKPEIAKGFDLLPNAIIDQHFLARKRKPRLLDAVAQHPGSFGVGIDESTALIVHDRRLAVVGKSNVTFILGASQRPVKEWTLKPGEPADLTALRRASKARALPAFPPQKLRTPEVAQGSLMIVGGGGLTKPMREEFIKRAGGPDSLIVVLPTASEGRITNPDRYGEALMFREVGAKNVKVLPQKRPEEISSPEFLDTLKQAKGVWFGGGRQWRFVDAYENTPAYQEFHNVLKRGGIIGGSSAGASIQAEYLVRGSPLGNTEMMTEGYEQGFAFLPGVAIDQHFTQRKRLPDLQNVIKTFPQLLGIGIDESTAIIVEKQLATVIGQGQVHFLNFSKDPLHITSIKNGEQFNLGVR